MSSSVHAATFFAGSVGQQGGYKSAFGTSAIFSSREHQAGFERIFARWRYAMETLWQDIQFAVRMMRKNLGFTTAAVLCLMLGIGATTGIFTVVNAVLLQPLPYSHPEQLIRVYTEFPTFPNGGLHRFWTSGPEFLDLRRDTHSWASLDAWITGGANLAGKTQPVRVTAAYLSGGLLETLAVAPVAGRLISQSDDVPGAHVVADISYGTWQSVFAGDPNVVGRETYLDGLKCTVIGVMPKGFQFPPGEQEPAQIWTALRLDPANPGNRGGHNYYLLGRMKPGVTAGQARGGLASLVQSYGEKQVPKTHSFHPKTHTIVSFPLQAEVVSSVRPALLMLLGAVVFVLLIASVNVANLLLARAEARRREIAIRGALGAGLVRLARQFVTEGLLLAFCGAVLGVALSFGGVRLVQLTNAGGIPRADEVSMDWRVLLFTLGTSLITGVLFGLAPLAPLLVSGISESLKDTAGSTTAAAGAQIFRRILVAGELAMALVLLIGCGLMLRAFWKLQEVHTGLHAENVVTMRVSLPSGAYTDNAKITDFWTRLDARLTNLPGVQSAALVSGLAPMRPPNMNDTDIEGFVPTEGGPIPNVDFYQAASTGYFATMGIRLMDGRLFDGRDVQGGPDAVIINKTMAMTFWPHQSPIGRRRQYGNVYSHADAGGRAALAGGSCARAAERDRSLAATGGYTDDGECAYSRAGAASVPDPAAVSLLRCRAGDSNRRNLWRGVVFGGQANEGIWSADGAWRARRGRPGTGDETRGWYGGDWNCCGAGHSVRSDATDGQPAFWRDANRPPDVCSCHGGVVWSGAGGLLRTCTAGDGCGSDTDPALRMIDNGSVDHQANHEIWRNILL